MRRNRVKFLRRIVSLVFFTDETRRDRERGKKRGRRGQVKNPVAFLYENYL